MDGDNIPHMKKNIGNKERLEISSTGYGFESVSNETEVGIKHKTDKRNQTCGGDSHS